MVGFVLFLSVFLAFTPLLASAQEGLVTCGPGTPGDVPCTYCHLLQMGDRILQWIMMILFPISAVMFTVGGFFIMTAGESGERYKKGMGVIKSAAIGILIALLAWLVLDTIFKLLTGPDYSGLGRPWYTLECPSPSQRIDSRD